MNGLVLESLLLEWRELSQTERAAMTNDDWDEVHRQQRHKERLQTRISTAVGERNLTCLPPALRAQVDELIGLESENARLVAMHRERVRHALAETDRAAGNLRGLNRTYGAAAGATWTSYS